MIDGWRVIRQRSSSTRRRGRIKLTDGILEWTPYIPPILSGKSDDGRATGCRVGRRRHLCTRPSMKNRTLGNRPTAAARSVLVLVVVVAAAAAAGQQLRQLP